MTMRKRLVTKAMYGPLAQKTIHSILKRELMEQFGFESMGLIADALIRRFLEILGQFHTDRQRLVPGQILWLAVAKDEVSGNRKTMAMHRLVPVRLTLLTPGEIGQLADGATYQDLLVDRVARLLYEAFEQGGVLALSDVSLLLGYSYAWVRKAVELYHGRHPDKTLPYRGTIHDMGGSISHKRQAVELHLKGLLTTEIAKRIHHDPDNVDRYINDFERIYQLHQDGKTSRQISFLTNISHSVVKEYLHLIDRYIHTEDTPGTIVKSQKGPKRRGKKPMRLFDTPE